MKKIRVLIVDDSALVRNMLSEMLGADPGIEIVGVAADPYAAREKIKQLNPDVLTLDVEMPRMDGITFLRNLMRLRPMPVLMISSLTEKGANITLEALALGAVDFVEKPKVDLAGTLQEYAEEIVAKVKMAAAARVCATGVVPDTSRSGTESQVCPGFGSHFKTTECILAIGASTGGTEAIKEVLARMPADAPGTVISQHIPEKFSAAFAQRVDGLTAMSVCEAGDGQQILRGHAYVAPGNRHLTVHRDGARYICRLGDGPPVNRHRPSVDVMFDSVAENVGVNAIGVILTGMGNDGARGLKAMRDAGAATMAQDEATSVVWGMPGQACRLDAVDVVLPLGMISSAVLEKIEIQTLLNGHAALKVAR